MSDYVIVHQHRRCGRQAYPLERHNVLEKVRWTCVKCGDLEDGAIEEVRVPSLGSEEDLAAQEG